MSLADFSTNSVGPLPEYTFSPDAALMLGDSYTTANLKITIYDNNGTPNSNNSTEVSKISVVYRK